MSMLRKAAASPRVFGLVFVLCACMGLMTMAHLRWDESMREALVARDNLAESRRFALLAQLDTERLLGGEAAIPRTRVVAQLDRALTVARDLMSGRSSITGLIAHAPAAGELAAATDAYIAALADARAVMLGQLDGFEAGGQALVFAQRAVDARAVAVESALLGHLAAEREALRRQDLTTLALVGALGLVVLFYLYVAHLGRDAAVSNLMKSEARLRAFVDSLPEAAFMLDRHGRYLESFGRSPVLAAAPETLIGRTLDEIFPADVSSRLVAVIRQALARQRTQSHEYAIQINGKSLIFDARVSPVPGTDRVVWVAWDVTARRLAEARVHALSRLYNFLSQVNQTIVWSTSEGELFERICRVAVDHGGYRFAWLMRADAHGKLSLQACAGTVSLDVALLATAAARPGVTQRVMASDALVRMAALDADEAWMPVALAAGCNGYVGLPIRLDERVVAVLGMLASEVDPDDRDEARLLDEVTTDLSFAMRRLRDEAQRAHAEREVGLQAAALRSTRDGIAVTGADGSVVVANRAFCELAGRSESEVTGRAPAQVLAITDAPAVFAAIDSALRQDGSWQGEVAARHRDGERYAGWLSCARVSGDGDGMSSDHNVLVLTDITKMRRTEEKLQQLAEFDPLTGLPNRVLIHARLVRAVERAARELTQLAVLFMDVDNFKTINDGLGHAAGDEVLSAVAQRLREGPWRRPEMLGRQGSDEFVQVLEGIDHPNDAALVAQQVFDCLASPIRLSSGQDIYVQASIGISIYPANGDTAHELIRDADAAMYQAKRAGRNGLRFYTDTFTDEATRRLALETRLREALEQDEFELHYQPLVSVGDNRLIGAEVLVRLRGPAEPVIGPATFVPIMESNGLIVRLGDRVRELACRQGRAWLDAGYQPGTLAINVSAVEIQRGGLDERLDEVLRQTGFPASSLELEMTESGVMDQGEPARAFLGALKRLGLRLSIDDFGTGYSSLAYLKRLPVDKLKIDRSFICDLPSNRSDAELTATIIELGHNLGMSVLAEGVETRAQLDFLAERGCDAYQGYLYSKPVPADEFERRFLHGA
jgi:diguanylate cyclase (GGDEF)-like protein/PAS domain S-box-containing protein